MREPLVMNGYFPTLGRRDHLRLAVKRLGRVKISLLVKSFRVTSSPAARPPPYPTPLRPDLLAFARAALGLAFPGVANALRRRRIDRLMCPAQSGWARCNHPRGHGGKCWMFNPAGTGYG